MGVLDDINQSIDNQRSLAQQKRADEALRAAEQAKRQAERAKKANDTSIIW